MADGQGPARFPTLPVVREYYRPYLDGVRMEGGSFQLSQEVPSVAAVLQTKAGTHILQFRFRGEDAPISLAPIELRLSFRLRFEGDFRLVQELAMTGQPVTFFPAWPIIDTWLIAAGGASRTAWRTSRRVGWGLVGVDHASHPPRAWIDGTEQTVVTSAPSAGQVQVPTAQTAGQHYETITTPSGLSGERLKLLYWPEYLISMRQTSNPYRALNDLVTDIDVAEILAGVYTGLS
jgi:hypothetical protein